MTDYLPDRFVDALLGRLRSVITELGNDGGQISPSVYETAQVLRLYPDGSDVPATLDWLLAQQQPDGGWGDMTGTMYRESPTLAAVLALYRHAGRRSVHQATHAGLAFLQRTSNQWAGPVPDQIPVAFELIWPRLLDDAEAAGLRVPRQPYQSVIEFGQRRRALMARLNEGAKAPAMFSWEAWGTTPDPKFIDAEVGVGHSPAATAAWLQMAAGREDLAPARKQAEAYLMRAALSTELATPGIVPGPWPIARFEQIFGLHTLLMAGLLHNAELRSAVLPQIEDLFLAVQPDGVGLSDRFIPDGDDTAAALAILRAAGCDVTPHILSGFEHGNHFSAYPFEMHASLTVTARAIHTLMAWGIDVTHWQETVLAAQRSDGLWSGDKWNTSHLYSTCLALLALERAPNGGAKQASRDALVAEQHHDGGWGSYARSTGVETAYGLFSLYSLARADMLNARARVALERGHCWLRRHYIQANLAAEHVWISKDLYTPQRIDQTFILCALLAPLVNTHNSQNSALLLGAGNVY